MTNKRIETGHTRRGRRATRPHHIPPVGWWDTLQRVFVKLGEQNVSILAAGVAFYAMLAIFPALGAIVTLYALVADPSDVQQHFSAMSTFLPAEVLDVVNSQLNAMVNRERQGWSIGLVFGVLFAVWSAHRGVDALVRAVTVAYAEKETRGIVKMNVLTYLLTLAAILFIVCILALLVFVPALFLFVPMPDSIELVADVGRWVVFFMLVAFAIGVLYRFGPPRQPARWRWLSVGATMATLLWVAGSAAFSFYVSHFGSYNETYGTLGAIIVLLLWFYLTSFSIVFGALLNAEMEHQTSRDTTTGDARPMGERGAYVADTLGEIPN